MKSAAVGILFGIVLLSAAGTGIHALCERMSISTCSSFCFSALADADPMEHCKDFEIDTAEASVHWPNCQTQAQWGQVASLVRPDDGADT